MRRLSDWPEGWSTWRGRAVDQHGGTLQRSAFLQQSSAAYGMWQLVWKCSPSAPTGSGFAAAPAMCICWTDSGWSSMGRHHLELDIKKKQTIYENKYVYCKWQRDARMTDIMWCESKEHKPGISESSWKRSRSRMTDYHTHYGLWKNMWFSVIPFNIGVSDLYILVSIRHEYTIFLQICHTVYDIWKATVFSNIHASHHSTEFGVFWSLEVIRIVLCSLFERICHLDLFAENKFANVSLV